MQQNIKILKRRQEKTNDYENWTFEELLQEVKRRGLL